MVDGNAKCETCGNKGNATEIVKGREMIYCRAVGGMVFPHRIGDCFVWKERSEYGGN
jgi:NADH pyrophosphatase NudC (nudix superfamily)